MTMRSPPPPASPRGPLQKCPACGYGFDLWERGRPRVCAPGRRLWAWGWAFVCRLPGLHLHQACERCGHAWTCANTEDMT
jgi:hypothetical protein